MKIKYIVFSILFFLETQVVAQPIRLKGIDSSFKIAENKFRIKCQGLYGMSYIEEITLQKDKVHFVKDGLYTEYYDTNFINIKRQGYYYNDSEIGLWREFYNNGSLKFEGLCKVIIYKYRTSRKGITILRIDSENPNDTTIYLDRGRKMLDSLFHLPIRYRDSLYYKEEDPGGGISYPPEQSIKVGEWKYYNDLGDIYRREYYKEGVLVKAINY